MEKQFVDVVFDRRKTCAKRGVGHLEVRVYLGRFERCYFSMGVVSPEEKDDLAQLDNVLLFVRKCQKIIEAM